MIRTPPAPTPLPLLFYIQLNISFVFCLSFVCFCALHTLSIPLYSVRVTSSIWISSVIRCNWIKSNFLYLFIANYRCLFIRYSYIFTTARFALIIHIISIMNTHSNSYSFTSFTHSSAVVVLSYHKHNFERFFRELRLERGYKWVKLVKSTCIA